MSLLYKLAKPILHKLDAEKAHNMTLRALKTGVVKIPEHVKAGSLETVLWNKHFPNPLGLAAGFDKNAEVIGPMLNMGFGFVEVGTVTPKPQRGNPKPRVFRHQPSESVINAMGFPNRGLRVFKENLGTFHSGRYKPQGIVGINIGTNKNQKQPTRDYKALIKHLGPLADYLTVNISSPNTPGLRNLQDPKYLKPLLSKILDTRDKISGDLDIPVLVKLAPDLDKDQQESIADVILDVGIDGLVLTNTTTDRPLALPSDFKNKKGGLSGPLLREKSTDAILNFYKLTDGKIPIIGVGGISNADDAYEKILAGASLLQIYTGMVYKGPDVIAEINSGLISRLERDGFVHISHAVGAVHKLQDAKQDNKQVNS